ncbi:hypothetical protein BH09PAT2_BH09PAT2_08640 [soil metagenome]
MPGIQKVEGFVLKKRELLEEDISVTLFTKEKGKLSVIAKGAKSFRSRRGAHLQTGYLIKATIREHHDIYYISSTDLVSAFGEVRTQEKMDTLYLYFYILDRMLAERQPEEHIFRITLRFFIKLSKKTDAPSLILEQSLQEVLVILGYIDQPLKLHDLLDTIEKNIDEKLPRHVIM